MAEPMLTFTSVRATSNKYTYFLFVDKKMIGHELDCSKLLDHIINDGMLYLRFENNEFVIHKEWTSIDYGYNKPQ